MQQHHVSLSSYHFKRSKCDGVIEVLNEGMYVMAAYSERTGVVKWQRVVLASQREQIERWLSEHYPVRAAAEPEAANRFSAQSDLAPARSSDKAKSAKRSL